MFNGRVGQIDINLIGLQQLQHIIVKNNSKKDIKLNDLA